MELGSLSSIGRYEVVERLGSGGFATVYLVRDPVLDSQVAAKVLAENWTGSPEIRDRFIREAQLLRRIDSHRVVTVHDIGELPSGQPYFVMSLANRGTLEGRMIDLQVAPAREAVNLLAHQVADCVSAVHSHDLIHRDIKPSNLLLTGGRSAAVPTPGTGLVGAGERLVLGDFGLAKDIALQATGLTIAAGTGGYAAPEQMSPTGAPDHQTDLYAATAVIYRIVTNTTPPSFDLGRQVVPFPDTEWWMVGQLGQFFRRGMAYHQASRHQSIEHWLADFVAAYGGGDLMGVSETPTIDPGPILDLHSAPTGVINTGMPPVPGPSGPPQPSVPHRTEPLAPVPLVPLNTPISQPTGRGSYSQPQGPAPFSRAQHLQLGDTSGPPPFDARSKPVGYVEPIRRRSAWPVVLVALMALAAIAAGGYYLALRGEAPVIVGPTEVVAGELNEFRATFEGADSFVWTDWNGIESRGDTFEFRGIVPGTVHFSVAAITDGQASRSATRQVLITPAPGAPVIVGPGRITVGVEETFTFAVEDGITPEWIDDNGSHPGDEYTLNGTSPGEFQVTLIVTRADGTRVGTRKLIQIVE